MSVEPSGDALGAFVRGETVLGQGSRCWVVELLRFGAHGSAGFRQYEAAVAAADNAKVVLRLYEGVRTVCDGAGLVPAWDGIFIAEFTSPAAFAGCWSDPGFEEARQARAASLEACNMIASDGQWAPSVAKIDEPPPHGFGPHSGPMAAPDWEPDMEVASAKAAAKSEQEAARIAVTDAQLNGFEDDREFDTGGRIWMLNLLKFEPGDDRAYYRAYSQQAGKHIGDGAGGESMTRGAGGGAQFVCSTCVTLVGEVDFDSLATMQYPDRASFLDHIRELNAITEGTEQADG